MDANRFRQDKAIDPSQLDVECIQQPDRFFHWAEAAVEASFKMDKAKVRLDVIKAQLEMKCRRSPEDFGLTRLTESAVDAGVKCHPEYQEAYNHFHQCRKEAKLLDAAVAAMEQKKHMMQELIKLHGQQYFAGPSVPRDLVSEWKEHQDRLTADINQQQRSRTRRRGQKR